ncbi:hypothetical protein M413DRAFT_447207, partial [Hebeloma cylindrosporum]
MAAALGCRRNYVGPDISPAAMKGSNHGSDFTHEVSERRPKSMPKVRRTRRARPNH